MPRTRLLSTPAVERMFLAPGADCVLDLDAVLRYWGVSSPVWVYALAILAYLMVVHALSVWALLSLARKERR
jgi:hypothetical protein